MNKQPFTTPPRWWPPRLSPRVVRLTRGYRRWRLRSEQRIDSVTVSGHHHVRQVLDDGHGILLTPNHAAHYDSAALYLAADQVQTPLYFMTAWQVFGMSSVWDRLLMQRLGCFSIDRESADRKAFKQAQTILREAPFPLVVFPEGDIYHITDRVTPFREGAAAVAVAAARKSDRPISIVPCGIKFWYQEDPTEKLHALMTRLDERLFLPPVPHQPLPDRIYRFAEALLSLKEIEYSGTTQSGVLTDRIRRLAESILNEMETRHALSVCNSQIPERVKNLRQTIIRAIDRANRSADAISTPERTQLAREMEDLFFVMQLYSYPGDYLLDNPSIERLAETLDKFEEDVLDLEVPTVRGRRRVEIRFGEPFHVPTDLTGRSGITDLTLRMQQKVQELIDQMCDGKQKARKSSVFDTSIATNPRHAHGFRR